MADLITLDEALDHLRLGDSPVDEDDVARKITEASEIVIDYVTHADKADWTDADAPWVVKAAVKLVLTTLYDDRDADPLTDAVKNVLRRHHTPALA